MSDNKGTTQGISLVIPICCLLVGIVIGVVFFSPIGEQEDPIYETYCNLCEKDIEDVLKEKYKISSKYYNLLSSIPNTDCSISTSNKLELNSEHCILDSFGVEHPLVGGITYSCTKSFRCILINCDRQSLGYIGD